MRGDDVTAALPLFQEARGGSSPTSPLQFQIVEISTKAAVNLNELWHSRLPIYKTGCCLYSKVCYAALFEGEYYAVAIWGHPLARLLPQKTWLELRRMAIGPDAPKNTASRMISVMAKMIRRKFPDVVNLISYQDKDVHSGTIYKASGWTKTLERPGASWNSPNSKNASGSPRTRPDLNKATGPKARWEFSLQKQTPPPAIDKS